MAEQEIKSKSKLGHMAQKFGHGTLRGLKLGIGVGVGMGIFFAAASMLFFGASLGVAVAGLLTVAVNTAVLGTALGAASGALKGIFTKARPNVPGAHGEEKPQQVQASPALAPQVAPQPVLPTQPSQSELQALTAQLNAAQQPGQSEQAANWQQRVAQNRPLAGTLQGRA